MLLLLLLLRGGVNKQVRQLALRWRLPSAKRPDSQGLCFLGPLAVRSFLGHLLGQEEGPVLHFPSGAVVGRHKGLWSFTAGQQKGVVPLLDPLLCRRCRGATGSAPTLSGPWSVLGKMPEANALFVVSREEERAAEEVVRLFSAKARELCVELRRSREGFHNELEDLLLHAAANGDQRALLAVKIRQLRTHLLIDSIQWIAGEPPLEFVASAATQKVPYGTNDAEAATAAAAAAAVVSAARRDAAVHSKTISDRGRLGPTSGLINAEPELIVQVRHSSGFDGVAKHRFDILRVSGGKGAPMTAELLLREPDVGLAPGQVAAFYRGDECLGAGRISPFQGRSLLRAVIEAIK